jgi:scyllo-inositol 2-dehydrogenase (NADP+)
MSNQPETASSKVEDAKDASGEKTTSEAAGQPGTAPDAQSAGTPPAEPSAQAEENTEGTPAAPPEERAPVAAAPAEAPRPPAEAQRAAPAEQKRRALEPGPVPTAVLGYGSAGRYCHSYLVSIEPGLALTAIASRDPGRREAAAAAHGVKTYETLDDLLARDEARLIIVATPHDSHAELAVKAMDAGRHVVVDKAMCLTTEEADRMIAASRRNNVMLSVFHNRRWDGDYLTLRKTIDSGLIGEVFLIEECVMGYGQPGGWRGDKAAGGGPLYDWGAHLVDHAVQIAGCPPAWVFCDTQSQRKWTTDAEEYVKCLIKFHSGLLYTVEVGYLARYSKPKFFALGTLGAFRKEGVDPQEAFMRQKRIKESKEDLANRAYVRTTINGMDTEIRPETVRGDWCAFYRNIAAHLSKGEELAVKPEGVRVNIQVTEAAMRSARGNQAVHL